MVKHLIQCLAHSRYLVNICWKHELFTLDRFTHCVVKSRLHISSFFVILYAFHLVISPVISPHPAELNLAPTSSVKTSCLLNCSFLWIFVIFNILTTHLACTCCPMYSLPYVHIISAWILYNCQQAGVFFSSFFLFLHIYLACSTDDCAGDFGGLQWCIRQGHCHKGIDVQLEKIRKGKLVFIEPEIMNQGLWVTFTCLILLNKYQGHRANIWVSKKYKVL